MIKKLNKCFLLTNFRLYSILWRAESQRQISERAAKAEPAQPDERPFSISPQTLQRKQRKGKTHFMTNKKKSVNFLKTV